MKAQSLSKFYLVGGTSLALQIGHRNSIDIDLFGKQEINTDLFKNILDSFGRVKITQSSKNILIANVDGIKVDFVNYQYPLIEQPLDIDGVRMVSKQDIAAMKLNAIAGRGSKKDFIDLYYLFNDFTLKQMMNFYLQKYHDGSEFMVLKSLSYFEEANEQPQPQMTDKNFSWQTCKQKIIEEVVKL